MCSRTKIRVLAKRRNKNTGQRRQSYLAYFRRNFDNLHSKQSETPIFRKELKRNHKSEKEMRRANAETNETIHKVVNTCISANLLIMRKLRQREHWENNRCSQNMTIVLRRKSHQNSNYTIFVLKRAQLASVQD